MSGSTSDNPFKNPSSANTATAPKCILLFSHSDNQIPSTSSVDFLKPPVNDLPRNFVRSEEIQNETALESVRN